MLSSVVLLTVDHPLTLKRLFLEEVLLVSLVEFSNRAKVDDRMHRVITIIKRIFLQNCTTVSRVHFSTCPQKLQPVSKDSIAFLSYISNLKVG